MIINENDSEEITAVVNNYLYGEIKRNYPTGIITDVKIDNYHHSITVDPSNSALIYHLKKLHRIKG